MPLPFKILTRFQLPDRRSHFDRVRCMQR
jgi:hypothetical protein